MLPAGGASLGCKIGNFDASAVVAGRDSFNFRLGRQRTLAGFAAVVERPDPDAHTYDTDLVAVGIDQHDRPLWGDV